jgi:hypothetical protein
VHGTVRFESGQEYEVSARPRKGVGFTENSVIAFRPVGGRGGAAIPAGVLRWFVGGSNQTSDAFTDLLSAITQADAEVILAWLDGLNGTQKGEGG